MIPTTGPSSTVTSSERDDTHPEEVFVNVNLAVPGETPVTIPLLFIVATLSLSLTQVPPRDGLSVVSASTQITGLPVIIGTISSSTVTSSLSAELQLVIKFI